MTTHASSSGGVLRVFLAGHPFEISGLVVSLIQILVIDFMAISWRKPDKGLRNQNMDRVLLAAIVPPQRNSRVLVLAVPAKRKEAIARQVHSGCNTPHTPQIRYLIPAFPADY